MENSRRQGFNTRAIHAGQEPDPRTGAVIPPLYQTTTFVQDGIGQLRNGYEYGRSANPTRTSLQDQLAALEDGSHAFSFSSGLAAEDALIRAALKPGDHIVLGNDVYGGTFRLIAQVLAPWGITFSIADMSDLDSVRTETARHNAHMLWLETPSNPLMKIADISALAEIAHSAGALLVIDNTFASPYLQQPLNLGADAVIHSTTKYIGGHSDASGGAVILNGSELAEKVGFLQFAVGAVSAPMEAWLTTRGLKTLGVRMDRHSYNAFAVAQWLCERDEVERVFYPGLPQHQGHRLAASQMRSFGGMVSVTFKAGRQAARRIAEETTLFALAESLGGIESLVNYPAEMTHSSVKGTPLEVPDNLIRFSVGLEDVADLTADLEQALQRLSHPRSPGKTRDPFADGLSKSTMSRREDGIAVV